MSGNRVIEELLASSRLALTNARNEADLQAALTPFGYDVGALDEGLDLLEWATTRYYEQQNEYAEQFAATNELAEKAAAARTAYLRHVKLARVAFKPATPGFLKLDLDGRRREDLVGWLTQARKFYRTLDGDASLVQVMGQLSLNAAAVTAALASLDEVEAAQVKQAKETAEAQAATRQRDETMAILRGYMRDFHAVAEVALSDRPQLREKLGVVVRA